AGAVIVGAVPVRDPFPHVAADVVETERVGWIGSGRPRPALPLVRRVGEVVAPRGIDVVAPRVATAVDAAAGGAFPFRLGRQADRALNLAGEPLAVSLGIVVGDQDDWMAAVAGRRLAALPGVGQRELAKDLVAAAEGDEGKIANRRRRMGGGAHEPRVLVVGDREAPDEELADVDA